MTRFSTSRMTFHTKIGFWTFGQVPPIKIPSFEISLVEILIGGILVGDILARL
jgi:hypothetical protein